MDGSFVQQLAAHVAKPLEVGGYAWSPTGWTVKTDPLADALKVYSLGALRDYVVANRDGLALNTCVIHVVSPQIVNLCGPLSGKFRTREIYISATAHSLTDGFLGAMKAHEEFMVGLQTRFVDTPERAAVLRLIGNIKSEKVLTSADDGVTQTVEARAGIALKAEAAVPNPTTLTPFRTFREVLQPASLFVLRVSSNGTSTPNVGLFEADGGAWRLTAMDRVRDWLTLELENSGVAVLA